MSGAPAAAARVMTAAEMWSALAEQAWRRGQAEAAAGDQQAALRWLERARRIAPHDHTIALSLALACLQAGDLARSAALFRLVAEAHDVAEAWTGLAACHRQLGQDGEAAVAIARVLSRHAASASAVDLARQIAETAGTSWCAIGGDGRLHASACARPSLDGVAWRPRWSNGSSRLPPRWRSAARLDVEVNGVAALGSPIDLRAITAIEGCVETSGGVITGWAWHPGDPGRDPELSVGGQLLTATEPATWSAALLPARPLARPRCFTLIDPALQAGTVHVTGLNGRDLLGSPLDPGVEWRSAAGQSHGFQPIWADVTGPAPDAAPGCRPVSVVIPVYRGREATLACLDSVLASVSRPTRIVVVDDASPDPALSDALDALGGHIHLIRHTRNHGFPAAANAGIAASAGHDVVLLNSDTLVPPGWLERLQAAAYSAPDIGTACPFSNDATILSYPDPAGGNPMPDLAGTVALARLAGQANGEAVLGIPTAVGSCMFIRGDCLGQVGPFREDLFAQGYGEENDFCLRARHRGWRHVAVPGAFVAHAGAGSFGLARTHLAARNIAVLNRLHPGYDALIARFIAADPLAPARRRIDALRWKAGRRASAVVMVTHAGGGGVDRVIAARCATLAADGIRPIVLRPEGGRIAVCGGGTSNLSYGAHEIPALARLLRPDNTSHVELHHLLGHPAEVAALAARLGIPHEIHVHDYAWFCPRIALVSGGRYCGEPDIAGCETCVAEHGSLLEEAITVPALVARSAQQLGSARRIVTASPDAAARLRRHFPETQPSVTPWEDDLALAPPPLARSGPVHVCVIGGIGVEKGFDVLLACVQDAAARRLPLRFTVVGHTCDDRRLMESGSAFVTGSYADGEVEALIREQDATFAWLPSIQPETWCFTLGHAWRAGLRASVFDIGAPAARVRRTGWGWLLPLGLPHGAINDVHLRFSHAIAPRTPSRSARVSVI